MVHPQRDPQVESNAEKDSPSPSGESGGILVQELGELSG